jgi:hypothetical protein
VHFEDQLSSAKKCGHMGGKVLVPTQEAVNKLIAARPVGLRVNSDNRRGRCGPVDDCVQHWYRQRDGPEEDEA